MTERYYVLGYDGENIILMTQKIFDSQDSAVEYAAQCASEWCAFIVKEPNHAD